MTRTFRAMALAAVLLLMAGLSSCGSLLTDLGGVGQMNSEGKAIKCPYCQKQISDRDRRCPFCGRDVHYDLGSDILDKETKNLINRPGR